MPTKRLLVIIALFVSFMVGVAPTAFASAEVDSAAAALKGGASVYNDPAAEKALSDSDVALLTDQIAATKLPIFVAVLPESTGDVEQVLVELKDAVNMGGIYAVVVGNKFRAKSTSGSAAALATEAFRSEKANGVAAVLTEFVNLADVQFNGADAASVDSGSNSAADTIFGLVFGALCLLIPIGIVVFVIIFFVRKRKRGAQDLADVKVTVDEDITEFGERLAAFDTSNPALDDAGRTDLQNALNSYDKAKSAADRLRGVAYVSLVTAPLEEGRYSLSCVEARLAGQPLPERRAPCFVDPRHGPSVADVTWEAPGLSSRQVPMCAACQLAVQTGNSPLSRQVSGRSGSMPYWMAGPQYNSYARGYYSPYDSMMTPVWVGTAVGMGAGAQHNHGGGSNYHASATDWSSTTGGDFGGGGGDSGGGSSGGGDF